MKITLPFPTPATTNVRNRPCARSQEHGFAVLVVFLLMMMMMALVIQSGLVLRGLRQELKLVEKRQIKRYPAAMMATNAIRQKLPVSTNTVTVIPHE